ncbi:MAG: hypothetical protein QM639_03260 [Rhodocyclaceae bacterium]
MLRVIRAALATLISVLVPLSALAAEPIELRVPTLSAGRHVYYVQLLKESLRAAGYEPHIVLADDMPQPRIWHALAANQISLVWGVQTAERDRRFTAVANPLTNGITAQRVLVVRKGTEDAYAHVRSLDDLRASGKIGGVGEGWYDALLWRANRLPVLVKSGDWRVMYRMLASGDREVDYLVRGVNEAALEIIDQSALTIEPRLLLQHDHDMRFYLSPSNAWLKPILEDALARADRNGLKRRLIARYITPSLQPLGMERRIRINLTGTNLPPRPPQ